MSPEAYLAWAKARALAYLDADPPQIDMAFRSLASDMMKRDDIAPIPTATLQVGIDRILAVDLPGMRAWIEAVQL